MSKIRVDESERYPFYNVGDESGYEVVATPEQVTRWRQAMDAFEVAQGEMGDLHDAAELVEQERRKAEQADREAREKAARVEQRRLADAAARRRQKAVDRLVGTVFDSAGNPVGEVKLGRMGLTVDPMVDETEPVEQGPRTSGPTRP